MPAAEETEAMKPTCPAFFVPRENLDNEEAARLAVGWLVDRSRVDEGELVSILTEGRWSVEALRHDLRKVLAARVSSANG